MSFINEKYFSTYEEVKAQEFDFIVIGAGVYGIAFMNKVLSLKPKSKILMIEKGTFFLPDHIQNLPKALIDLNQTAGTRPWESDGDIAFMPQIPFVGGRGNFWNGWIPMPYNLKELGWDDSFVKELQSEWQPAADFLGRRYNLVTAENSCEQLRDLTRKLLTEGMSKIDTGLMIEHPNQFDSSIATGRHSANRPFGKFSPVSVLMQAVADKKSVMVLTDCLVKKFQTSGGKVTAIETSLGSIDAKKAQIVLACNTLEATEIVLQSGSENPLVGKNLSGHIRSWLGIRVHKKYFQLDEVFQAGAFYVPGYDTKLDRYLHTHVSSVYNPFPERDIDLLYQILPDASMRESIATYMNPDYVVFELHTMGEFLGTPDMKSPNHISMKDGKMHVNVTFEKDDEATWDALDSTVFQIIEVLADGKPFEYQQADNSYAKKKPERIRNKGAVHESGTLWMGISDKDSVCNLDGRLHHLINVYGTGGMLFPRPGSWNPTYTGVAMAFNLARKLC